MKCTSCGSDFASDQIKCPYCGTVNEHALQLAKELQSYDAAYEKKRDELLETGTNQVLKHLTIGLGITFLVIVLVFFGYIIFLRYRPYYEVTGKRLEKNKASIARYLEEGQYIRAYLLASTTDPTGELFTYYPEYKDDLLVIYNYSIIQIGVLQSMDSMDEGDNYASLEDTQLTSISIFYQSAGDGQVARDLKQEVDGYLKNYYRLTDDEIEDVKRLQWGDQLILDGSADVEAVTKERMEAYFE